MTHKPTAHREFWIRRGTNKWSYKVYQEDGSEICMLDHGDDYYDKISTEKANGGIHTIEYSAVKDLLDALESIAHMRCSWKLSQEIAKAALTKFREGKAR